MTNFKMMITTEGKHPASKWAGLAADEIIEISADAPETKMREAMDFKTALIDRLTKHHQHMMNDEQEKINDGKHDMDAPYETEKYTDTVVDEICSLAKGKSFSDLFNHKDTRDRLAAILNRNFKSAKLVERSHFHTENERLSKKK